MKQRKFKVLALPQWPKPVAKPVPQPPPVQYLFPMGRNDVVLRIVGGNAIDAGDFDTLIEYAKLFKRAFSRTENPPDDYQI